ncbi:MAG: hypothetical protein SFY69_12700 [Planctomycetota bacterium]|nr:hypothetical protein [Planctomycetota bacterium]
MEAGKVACVAAGLVCAQAAFGLHRPDTGLRVRVDVGRAAIRVGVPARECGPAPRLPHRREHPRFEHRADVLHLDGREVVARIVLERQSCGRLAAKVVLDTCDARGLPRIEEINLRVFVDGREWCAPLRGHCEGGSSATFVATDGPRVGRRECATAVLTVRSCRDIDTVKRTGIGVR